MSSSTINREKCYLCFRPLSSCLCSAVSAVETQSCFVILMHPKEFKKTKNGTGHLTHLSLPHSHLFIGIDFTHHQRLNALLEDPSYSPFLLYPSDRALNLSKAALPLKQGSRPLFVLIDSTWACSKKMIRLSENLSRLPKISFETTQVSNFLIKTQPNSYCLSTIETTQRILQLLNEQNIEALETESLQTLIRPFTAMVDYQLDAAQKSSIRYKAPSKIVSVKEIKCQAV